MMGQRQNRNRTGTEFRGVGFQPDIVLIEHLEHRSRFWHVPGVFLGKVYGGMPLAFICVI